MFIKVKRFQQLESLILEAKAIELTTQFDAALADFTKNAAAPDYTKFDNLIVSMLDLQIENQHAFINKFGEDRAANLITGYLGYCNSRVTGINQTIVKEYASAVPDLEEIRKNQEDLVGMYGRIDKIPTLNSWKILYTYLSQGKEKAKKESDKEGNNLIFGKRGSKHANRNKRST